MKTKPTQNQQPSTGFQNIDADQLDAVLGGCACGCGQTNCNCANGSCSTSASPIPGASTQRPFGW
jgi:hypothetical protein